MIRDTKKLSTRAIINPILLISNKTIMELSHRNHVFWPVYIIIGNLDAKTY